jgi:hypothetical protein
MMILNLQMNDLLLNDQAESGVNPDSEDLDLEEDDGPVISIINRSISALIRSTNSCCDANSSSYI